jgi:hypothetical protein
MEEDEYAGMPELVPFKEIPDDSNNVEEVLHEDDVSNRHAKWRTTRSVSTVTGKPLIDGLPITLAQYRQLRWDNRFNEEEMREFILYNVDRRLGIHPILSKINPNGRG